MSASSRSHRATVFHRTTVHAGPWPGVHLLRIDSALQFTRHYHDSYGVGVIDAGAHRSASGRGSVDAFAGHVITTNPGEIHDGRPLGCARRRWRILYAPVATPLLRDDDTDRTIEFDAPVIADPAAQRAVLRLMDRIEAATLRPHAGARLACEEAFAGLVGWLQRRAPAPSRTPSAALRHARAALEASVGEPPSLATLAAHAGLSRYQLLRQFAQAYGLTPFAWLQQQRLAHARAAIARGHTLAQAAAEAGFADQSHLTRLFRRHFGMTPGQWAQCVRGTVQ